MPPEQSLPRQSDPAAARHPRGGTSEAPGHSPKAGIAGSPRRRRWDILELYSSMFAVGGLIRGFTEQTYLAALTLRIAKRLIEIEDEIPRLRAALEAIDR